MSRLLHQEKQKKKLAGGRYIFSKPRKPNHKTERLKRIILSFSYNNHVTMSLRTSMLIKFTCFREASPCCRDSSGPNENISSSSKTSHSTPDFAYSTKIIAQEIEKRKQSFKTSKFITIQSSYTDPNPSLTNL